MQTDSCRNHYELRVGDVLRRNLCQGRETWRMIRVIMSAEDNINSDDILDNNSDDEEPSVWSYKLHSYT